jgi:hypothetical protein
LGGLRFALPITVSLEWIGEKVLGDRVGRRIDASRGISAKRILFALAFFVAIFALGTLIVVSLGAVGGGFWETNFRLGGFAVFEANPSLKGFPCLLGRGLRACGVLRLSRPSAYCLDHPDERSQQ